MKPTLNPSVIEFSQLLSYIPSSSWDEINKNEPEWIHMEKYLHSYGFGPFATLMITCGLNDYQLKQKAEIGYWPLIDKILKNSPIPNNPSELGQNLIPFYSQERLADQKINRMNKFIRSSLSSQVWKSSPNEINERFDEIWMNLAQVMNQSSDMKTIVFAMKCLGLSILMTGIQTIPFQNIPIPVDFRIMELTSKMSPANKGYGSIQSMWTEILEIIRKQNPSVTMIHLDSLAWQIGRMNKDQIRSYFTDLQLPDLGEKISNIISMETKRPCQNL